MYTWKGTNLDPLLHLTCKINFKYILFPNVVAKSNTFQRKYRYQSWIGSAFLAAMTKLKKQNKQAKKKPENNRLKRLAHQSHHQDIWKTEQNMCKPCK